MSVYKPGKSPFWHYDFVWQGVRFHGSTGVTTRRAAERVEILKRREAAESGGKIDHTKGMTLDQAAGRWWEEVGHRRAGSRTVELRIETVLRLLGPKTPLVDIDGPAVAKAIEKRRGETYRRGKGRSAKRYPLSNATVNRDVIETLRPILRRAALKWGVKGLPAIAWKDLRLKEPPERIAYFTSEERQDWLDACEPVSRLALRLLLTYGLRFNELFFAPRAYDPDGPRLRLEARKGDVPHVLPIRKDDGREIAARVGRAQEAQLSSIWFEETPAGKLVEVSYGALHSRLRAAARRAGVSARCLIHTARHDAGTQLVRRGRNLLLAKSLLGHKDIRSTMRYAHALEEDLRAALDSESRNSPEPEMPETENPIEKQEAKKA
jgi:integrase